MKSITVVISRCFLLVLLLGLVTPGPVFSGAPGKWMNVRYRYFLSDFSGPMHSFQSRLVVPEKSNELFVYDHRQNDIRVFGENGMEVYRMGEAGEFGGSLDFAVDDRGDIYVLFAEGRAGRLERFNFRGEPAGRLQLRDVPAQFADLAPSRMVFRQGWLYLVDCDNLKIVVIDREGRYQAGYSVAAQVRQTVVNPRKKAPQDSGTDITGFTVDGQGNMFFTVAPLATAFRLTPAGQLDSFGFAGSSPGRFGVVAGITVDDQGNIYLADKLRCVVMLYDKDLEFINEFGGRGYGPAGLIVPTDVAVINGDVFVSQAANRGVSVFHVQTTLGADGSVAQDDNP